MQNVFLSFAAALGLCALAACTDEVAGPDTEAAGVMAPASGGPPFVTRFDASVSDAAVEACRSALEAQTQGGVTVVGSEFSEANTAIYMRVGANGAPWRCLVSNDGTGASLMFMGDEGAL